ncbi:MAG: hypothetical protein ACYTEE_12025 [Planctomycetota bacterium]
MSQSKTSHTKASRMNVWGDSLLNKLPAGTRKKRKRDASKKRRIILRQDDTREGSE